MVGENEEKNAKGRELKKGDSEEPPWIKGIKKYLIRTLACYVVK